MPKGTVAMWRTAEGLAGLPGQTLGGGFHSAPGPVNSTIEDDAGQKSRGRAWIPALDKMPPIVQFGAHAAQWLRAKCVFGTKQGTHLRLVGQLALGAKRHLSLVEVGGTQFLVGGGAENVTVIVPIASTTALNGNDTRNCDRGPQP
ncbi:MAG: flagellar biosynthetic protein FliO [Acidobacteriaceae bacterium]